MYYVYLLRSIIYPDKTYVGYTTNLKQRLETHNTGGSTYTRSYRPWKIIVYLEFEKERAAKLFEQYLKSGSAIAFAKKRLW